ncbi:triadin [Eudromia elegans]
MSTTTTIVDGKNGSLPSTSMKVGKKSVTEDLATTFSSPAAWLLVVALIVTWSAVAIVMFDLVDYKAFAVTYTQHCDDPCLPPGRSVNKLSTEPLRIIHEAFEESTDWLYGFISLLSDIVWSDDDDSDEVIHSDKAEKQEKIERKEPIKVTHKDKLERHEKPEKRERHAVTHKEKPEKLEKPEKKSPSKAIQKEKAERHEKVEKKAPSKEEKKVKSTKVEVKVKKEMKDGKDEAKTAEKLKHTETKTTEVGLIKAKPKVKEEKALQTVTKSEKKDQYAFCRYVIDMFAQGDFYPGHKETVSPRLLLEHSPRKKPATTEETEEEKKVTHIKKATTETKKKEKEGKKEKAHEKTAVPEIKKADKKEAAVSKELKKLAKAPAAKPPATKPAAPDPGKEKDVKPPAATKDKEHTKTKEGKNPTALKDKETLKGKNPKNPEGTKEKEPDKRKDVKPPAVLKEKESSKGKEVKISNSTKEKDEKTKQQNPHRTPTEKSEHEAVRHEKGVPPAKPGGSAVKEAPRHHNLTTAPVRYFQCVFLNGPNGYGLPFPTNPPSKKEEKTHPKTSKRKTRKPGQ